MGTGDYGRLSRQAESNRDRTGLDDTVRVAFYGRVSTQHEQQMGAFENQMEWYRMLLKSKPNWEVVAEYTDRGITGTDASVRKGFMQMYQDAEDAVNSGKGKPWDLIVTREVCRFSRNTIDSLTFVRKFKKLGIEVFFFNDGIWSLDRDGELRLTIFSALAQDEARKTSERVLSGLETCREKGVLFGNGNILGYDLVRNEDTTKNTYVKNEDAETIRQIFDWYLQGYGEKAIATKLIEGGYTNTIGKVSFNASYISRIIRNKTYAGYKCYNKSRIVDYLDHSREQMEEEEYMYIKGDWKPIVPVEDWEKAQRIRYSKTRNVAGLRRGKGKRPSQDKWCRKLFCQCGHVFQRQKWGRDKSGMERFGYVCGHVARNKNRTFYEENGLSGEGYCNVSSFPEWKLEFQFGKIIDFLRGDLEEVKTELTSILAEESGKAAEKEDAALQASRLENEKKRKEIRLQNLMDKWLDGRLTNVAYEEKREEIDGQIEALNKELALLQQSLGEQEETPEDKEAMINGIKDTLDAMFQVSFDQIDEDFVNNLVVRITPTEDRDVKWYLNFGGSEEIPMKFREEDYGLLEEIFVGYEEARASRKAAGSFLRKNQWRDTNIQIYVRI